MYWYNSDTIVKQLMKRIRKFYFEKLSNEIIDKTFITILERL